MMLKRWMITGLALCLALSLSACGGQTGTTQPGASAQGDGSSVRTEEPAALTEYVVEGLGIFQLPEGFSQESGEISDPLPCQYAVFEKDGYCIQANRFGLDAYESAGVPLPADLEEYSTRSGVRDSVAEGTEFAYDSQGNFAAQFEQEDETLCYYVLLQGEASFGNIFLTAPEDVFDAETAALWLSGAQLE